MSLATPMKGAGFSNEEGEPPKAAGDDSLETAAKTPDESTIGASADNTNNANDDENDSSRSKDPRQAALDEANEVIEALQGGEVFLNGFNLLQVIANPRGNPHDLTFSASSYHGRYGSQGLTPSRHGPGQSRHGGRNSLHGARTNLFPPQAFGSSDTQSASNATAAGGDSASSVAGTVSSTDYFSETYYQLESTLFQVTEQVEGLNGFLEDISRKILDEDPYADADDLPEAQLPEFPVELQASAHAITELKEYLAKSGVLAHKFRELEGIHQHMDAVRLDHPHDSMKESSAEEESSVPKSAAAQNVILLKEEIPEVFWQEVNDLDLTHMDTFQTLFFSEKLDVDTLVEQSKSEDEAKENHDSILSWFPLVSPDSLNHGLDKVEIALLEAVREQSSAFFEESIRFATLQEWIETLLNEVISLQVKVDSLMNDSIRPMQTVPSDHSQKQEWQAVVELLDSADELVRCKASIAGYLSAADDLTALEQVYFGRQKMKENNLLQLQALQGVAKIFDQYEKLIVTNLRDELVESFLDWNANIGGVSSSPTAASTYTRARMSTVPGQGSQNIARVRDIIHALTKCHGLSAAAQAYKSRINDVMRLTVRTIVAEFADSAPTGASGMTLDRFLDCLDMTMEQLLTLLASATAVDKFCVEEGFDFRDESDSSTTIKTSPMAGVVAAAAELSSKSISDLLRTRKEAHSLLSLEEMKRLWDKCTNFAGSLESDTGFKPSALRSTLLAQAKAFIERKHDSNTSSLLAALDSERWSQCDVGAERQAALTRLCTGRALITRNGEIEEMSNPDDRQQEVEVNGVQYKVVWSCLLLVEMVIGNLSAASHFTGSASSIVGKTTDLLRLFNNRTSSLVLGAKAIHSAARLKNINAKHLSLVTQCLGMVISILPNIRASLMAHLPPKQHRLLNDIDQIKKEYSEHNENVLNKFVTIVGSIIENQLAPRLPTIDFDTRARENPTTEDGGVKCCIFFDGISSNTRKMHHVLFSLLPPVHLQDVFSRIFASIDTKIPTILSSAAVEISFQPGPAVNQKPSFRFPQTDEGKKRLLLEAESTTKTMNALDGVQPWDFSLIGILERKLEYSISGKGRSKEELDSEAETDVTTVPSDNEDSPDHIHTNGSVSSTPEQDQKPTPIISNNSTSAPSEESSPNEVQATEEAEPSVPDQENLDDQPTSQSDYPVEETAL